MLNVSTIRRLEQSLPATIRGKLLVGLLPGFVVLILLTGVGLYALDILAQANSHMAEASWEMAATHSLQLALQEALMPPNDYLIHGGNVEERALFAELSANLDQAFAQAKDSYGEEEERRLIERAEAHWQDVRQRAQAILALDAEAITAPETVAAMEEMDAMAAVALRDLSQLNEFVLAEMQRTEAASQAARRTAIWLLLVSSFISIVGGALFTVVFSRYLTRPIEALRTGAVRIGSGDLDFRLDLPQRDELGALAAEFNRMAAQVQKRTRQLQAVSEERTRYAEQLRRVLDRTVQVQEAERRRIAKDIHDGVSQWVMGALYELQAARVRLSDQSAEADRHLIEAQQVLRQVKDEMRRVIYDLHPPLLESNGLVAALRSHLTEFQAHTPISCTFRVEGRPQRLPPPQELALYRIAQEALNNIARHAEAQQANVTLGFCSDHIYLRVTDNGRGFDLEQTNNTDRTHLGLLGMHERATAVGGTLVIDTKPGRGTRIEARIPLTTAGNPVTIGAEEVAI